MKAKELKALYEESVGDINRIKKALENIQSQEKKALDANVKIAGENGLLDQIKISAKQSEEKLSDIEDAYNQIYRTEEEGGEDMKAKLDTLLKKFNDLKVTLWGTIKKTEDGEEKVPGLMDNINDFHTTQKKKYDELYGRIENELLAGATTVNLAGAYAFRSESYKKPNYFWLGIFFLSIALIIFLLLDAINGWIGDASIYDIFTVAKVEPGIENGSNKNLITFFLIKLGINIGIISSLLWIAMFSSKQFNQNKRLSEEYAYKETFAKSFEGYRRQAEELEKGQENKEVSLELMKKLVEMSAYNPVETMESKTHKEKHPTMKIAEKSVDTLSKVVDKIGNLKSS